MPQASAISCCVRRRRFRSSFRRFPTVTKVFPHIDKVGVNTNNFQNHRRPPPMPRKVQAQQQFHPRTTAQAREWLVSNGITVSGFARQLGVNRTVVDDLLRGRSQGKYGDAHTAAIALGLKAPPNYAAKVQTSKRSRG
ncbi:hypothetical protein [Xanthomonas arboricola]|uniref:hypothetical protein n=2 Tax=Xanthomonas arboricola TaxID=56448 RepID=UPI002805EA45|nr:hypothetical protein [Xanthomonas arboricola]